VSEGSGGTNGDGDATGAASSTGCVPDGAGKLQASETSKKTLKINSHGENFGISILFNNYSGNVPNDGCLPQRPQEKHEAHKVFLRIPL
jgi:hypothetical protein